MNKCLATYKEISRGHYSTKALKQLFDGKKVSHFLDFEAPEFIYDNIFESNIKQISISGVQIKYSLKLESSQLRLTESGGEYLLKPIPVGRILNLNAAPENEHLTMQIASQIFGIETAINTLIYFKNHQSAYLVKRFDVREDGSKWLQEDFAQIKQVSKAIVGENYKYEGSYEEIGALIKTYCSAWRIEIERFYKLVIFNYLFSNGDAHLKNFSLIQTKFGDFRLSPAYDLLCTYLHTPNESAMALDLFANDFSTPQYDVLGYYSFADFYEFGIRLEIPANRVGKLIENISNKSELVKIMIENSFLDKNLKELYYKQYENRLRGLKYRFGNEVLNKIS
jgi:serine/threonine-protein kinase HipA